MLKLYIDNYADSDCNFLALLPHTIQYRFIEVWQPKAGLHTDNQYIHAYNADRNKIEIGLLKIN